MSSHWKVCELTGQRIVSQILIGVNFVFHFRRCHPCSGQRQLGPCPTGQKPPRLNKKYRDMNERFVEFVDDFESGRIPLVDYVHRVALRLTPSK